MNWWIPKTRGQILTVLCAAALLASNAFGGLKSQRIIVEIVDGVDKFGNADPLLGFDGPGKSYKNLHRGIIVQINKAYVTNEFLKPKHFTNRGLQILDPQTNEILTTTSDLLVVKEKQLVTINRGPPVDVTIAGASLWIGKQIKVFDPRYPVLPAQVVVTP